MHCGFCVGALWFEVEWIWVGWDFAAARSTEPALLPSDPSWAWSLTNPGIASHRMVILTQADPKHHLLPSPLSSVLTFWQSFHLSRAWTSWFTICCCRSLLKLELKSGSFLEQLPLDNQFDYFPGKFLDKHLIETNTVSSFPQNFHWLDGCIEISPMALPDSTEIMLHLQRDRNMKIQIQKYNALLADAASATFRLDEQGGWGASGFCH